MRKIYCQNILGIFTFMFFLLQHNTIVAQCPPNIDFEQGNFTGWQCWTGSFNIAGIVTVNPTLPIAGRHDIISNSTLPKNDKYGNFPKLCPNGSGYSIKLGNEVAGGTADRVSYTFTIPPTENKFNLIYNYAIVLNDNGIGGHPALYQPRLTIAVVNLSTNATDTCNSFNFNYSATNPLPGFFQSKVNAPNGTLVDCKGWSASSINLDGHAGETIEIIFTATGCGQNAHFGYAYIDVNTQCSSAFIGANFCPDDTLVNVTAPFGYQDYAWYDGTHTTKIRTGQILTLMPPPTSGDSVIVDLTPYNGYGCVASLKAYLLDTLTIHPYAGPDKTICKNTSVQLGAPPLLGLVYRWSPGTGLSDSTIANPFASPTINTQYVLNVRNNGGGCSSYDTVNVNIDNLSNSLQLIGSAVFCAGKDSAILKVLPAFNIQWYKDGVAINGANQTILNVLQTGAYYAVVTSAAGCTLTTATKNITVNPGPIAGFNINANTQCISGNSFVFTNTSTIAAGTLQYYWNLGDGTIDSIYTNVTHTYADTGTYMVKLLVTSPGAVCADSILFVVHVIPTAYSAFAVNATTQCFKNNLFVFTNKSTASNGTLQYVWDFGDGTTPKPTAKDTTHSYASAGTYQVKLTASANGGCSADSIIAVTVNLSPIAAFTVNSNTQCFANNQFVFTDNSTVATGALQYTWDFGDNSFSVAQNNTHSYSSNGNYIVKLLVNTTNACADSISLPVLVNPSPAITFTTNALTQCFKNNSFVFTNTTTVVLGTLQYLWSFGDGVTATTQNVSHTYTTPNTYQVKYTGTAATGGCKQDSIFNVTVNPSPLPDFIINNAAQCFAANNFVFTNSSTTQSGGSLQYTWYLGDGTINNTTNVSYNYLKPESYWVKLIAVANGGCTDSITKNIVVYPSPLANFTVLPVCQNLQLPLYNRTLNNTTSTLNYLWNFGNGHLDNTQSPIYTYTQPGTYTISLIVSSVQCPSTYDTIKNTVTIETQLPGIRYSDKDAAYNFPEPLQARSIGDNVIWFPDSSLSNRFSYSPTFTGINPQLYTIKLTTATGCITVDTQFVKTHKKIEIYVPKAFTPNGDGINDKLRPVLIGFNKVNYFRVFDRWGQLLFSMNSDQPGWDGKIKGIAANMQTVVWMIEAVDVDGIVHQKQGTTILLR